MRMWNVLRPVDCPGFCCSLRSRGRTGADDTQRRRHRWRSGQDHDPTKANGMAVAVIDHGKVIYVHAYGIRNAKGDPLTTDTVMYGASLTKTVFAYTVMQLVDQGKLELDKPIKDDLDNPLPSYGPDPVFPDKYGPYKDLADDPRWKTITPRMCLNHSTGFSNFWFIEPDQKLHIHFNRVPTSAIPEKDLSSCNSWLNMGARRRAWGSTLAI